MSEASSCMLRFGQRLQLVREVEPCKVMEVPQSEKEDELLFLLKMLRYEVKGIPKSIDGILLVSPDGPIKRKDSTPASFADYKPNLLDSWNPSFQFSILENLKTPSGVVAGFVPAEKDFPRRRGIAQWIHGLRMLGFQHTVGILGPGDQLTHSSNKDLELEMREMDTLNRKTDVSVLEGCVIEPVTGFRWGGRSFPSLSSDLRQARSIEDGLPHLLAEKPDVLLLPETPMLNGMQRGCEALARLLRQYRFQGLLVVSSPKLHPGWYEGEAFGVINTYGTIVFLVPYRPMAFRKPILGSYRIRKG